MTPLVHFEEQDPDNGMNPNLFEKIEALALPEGQYVIIGGGVLAANGLVEWDHDIDMAVSDDVYTTLQSDGWNSEEAVRGDKMVLREDVYDIGVGFGDWTLDQLLEDADVIKGIPFMNLGKLAEWKRQTGREKDLRHVALIEAHLAKEQARLRS